VKCLTLWKSINFPTGRPKKSTIILASRYTQGKILWVIFQFLI
jgi:hypothetical protein